MPIHQGMLRLGYLGDNGLGVGLALQVINGTKTATCLPLAEMTEPDIAETMDAAGRTVVVTDPSDRPMCEIQVTATYRATFREPSEELVKGEGYGSDIHAFQEDHAALPLLQATGSLARQRAYRASAELYPEQQLAVVLHDGLSWPSQRIGAATGWPSELVSQRLRRGRQRLAAALRDSSSMSRGERRIASPRTVPQDHVVHCAHCQLTIGPEDAGGTRRPDDLNLEIAVVLFKLAPIRVATA